jgi:hypothetical protein
LTIEFYTGTPGSGKSYHALEAIIDALDKGKHVIANFPLNFTEKMIRDGHADRFMFIPDEFLMGEQGMAILWQISYEKIYDKALMFPEKSEKMHRFFGQGESLCLVVIDESGNYYPPDESTNPVQKKWKLFFRQHRKMGYDFILISQGTNDINKSIRSCVEYEVAHRKANRVAPFKWLPWTLFFYVRYWTADRKRQLLNSESSIYVKRFAALYDTHMMFGEFEQKMDISFEDLYTDFKFEFGNTLSQMEGLDEDSKKISS